MKINKANEFESKFLNLKLDDFLNLTLNGIFINIHGIREIEEPGKEDKIILCQLLKAFNDLMNIGVLLKDENLDMKKIEEDFKMNIKLVDCLRANFFEELKKEEDINVKGTN